MTFLKASPTKTLSKTFNSWVVSSVQNIYDLCLIRTSILNCFISIYIYIFHFDTFIVLGIAYIFPLSNTKTRWNFSLVASYFLLIARCSLPFAHCSLLFACHFLFVACCSLPYAHCSFLFTFSSLLVEHYFFLVKVSKRFPILICTKSLICE